MKKWPFIILPLILFSVLAAVYTADPNRRYTASRLAEASRHTTDDYILSSLNVTAIAQDRNRLIWIGTSAGINVYNGHDYIQFSHDINDSTALPDDYINTLHLDRSGRMWAGTQNGVARYEGAGRFRRFRLPTADGNITSIGDAANDGDTAAVIVANRTSRWRIGSDGTVARTSERAAVTAKPDVPDDPTALFKPKDIVTCTFADADSNVWLGFRNAGYQVLSDNITAYRHANANQLAANTEGHDIVALASAGRHILAGTTMRLHIYDSKTNASGNTVYRQLFKPEGATRLFLNNIVARDSQSVWLVGNRQIVSGRISGTQIAAVGGICTAGARSRTFGCGTRMGEWLYVSRSDGHIARCRFGEGRADSIAIPYQWFDEETQLAPLPGGRLLLFMRDMKIALLDTRDNKVSLLNTTGAEGAVNTDPAFARTDSRHGVWLGTKRSGLYRLDLQRRHISRMDFPADVHIQAMLEDRRGQLWITTLKDVVCYQPQKNAALVNSLASSSQQSRDRQYFDNSACLAPNGDIVVGSSDGCVFIPADMNDNRPQKEGLCIYALGVMTAEGRQLTLNADFSGTPHYTFAHDENELTLRFFYPNYARRSSLMYQYMLEGYDRNWRTPGYSGTAHFAHIPPGKYTFRLRLVPSPGQPPVAERQVAVTVKAAPWQSAAAWVLYLMAAGLAASYINSLYLRIRTNRMRFVQEQHERERERRTNEMNMSFFANISHEFRNPLTIIAGPLVAMQADGSLPDRIRVSLGRVCLSVNRMLRLIDQMLDFNQLETDALRLKVSEADAVCELRSIAAAFGESARVRGITLDVQATSGGYIMPLDTDKFEKIMSNLFTNALKHTPDGGRIRLAMDVKTTADGGRWLEVEVFNSGSHIADSRLADVFKRYYQLADAETQHKYGWGTGIGLYYVKRLVGLHHGEIAACNVSSETDSLSDGVAFRFRLPADSSAYGNGEFADTAAHVMQIPIQQDDLHTAEEAEETGSTGRRNRRKILVVDDDVDVAGYIRSIFAADYAVENRYSAEAALKDMAEIRPDIILSDIIMGEMSGFDFCRTLKADIMWSHIPMILITAKSDIGEQIRGLRLGAVAYVTKPFDPSYLLALVEAQLSGVQSLRRILGDSTSTESIADEMSEQDRRFMDELYAIMERRSAEQELSVAAVCHEMLVSQSKFNYKLKQLTGDTPGTFFRKYKLNRAARLLREGRHNVSEVAAMTGFSTAAHFSVAFKKQFGVSPSEYDPE